ncbi:MAG: MFS transporter [Thermoleophilia bacterium]
MTGSAKAGPAALARRTFRALRIHNFRLFFFSQVVSMSGTWMQSVAQSWLVLELTGSGIDLGVTVGLQFGPVLVLGAWAGALADRVDKRKLLLVTQSLAAGLALVLGALTAADVVTVRVIWVLAGLTGVTVALDMPSRQSFVYEMVGPDDLANAVGLNAVVINSSRIIGPALGGVLIAAFGVAPCFFFNAASFGAVIAALLVMRTAELRRSAPVPRRPGQVREGLRYAWRTPELRVPLLMMAVVSTLAYNYSVVLPLLTKSAFGRGAGAYGALFAAMGVGALAGSLLMASRARPSRRLLVASTLAFGVVTLLLAAAPGYLWGMALLVPLGVAGVLFISTTNSLLQLNADDAMRGRVMALWSVVFLGSTPVGGPLTGLLARGFGVRVAIAGGGAAALATAVGAGFSLRRRQLRAGTCEVPVCLPDGPAPGDALGEGVPVRTAAAQRESTAARP